MTPSRTSISAVAACIHDFLQLFGPCIWDLVYVKQSPVQWRHSLSISQHHLFLCLIPVSNRIIDLDYVTLLFFPSFVWPCDGQRLQRQWIWVRLVFAYTDLKCNLSSHVPSLSKSLHLCRGLAPCWLSRFPLFLVWWFQVSMLLGAKCRIFWNGVFLKECLSWPAMKNVHVTSQLLS